MLSLLTDSSAIPIRIVTVDDYPPYSFTLPDQTKTGLYVDFWELWSKHNQMPIEIYITSFEKSLDEVRYNGAVHSGLFISESRKKWADFSIQFDNVDSGIIYNTNHSKSTKLKDLKNIKIAVQDKSLQADHIQSHFPHIDIEHYTEADATFYKLFHNEIDAIAGEIPFMETVIGKLSLYNSLILSDEILMNNTVHAMVAKNQQGLLKIINKGIRNIPIQEFIKLENKWLPKTRHYFEFKEYIPYLTIEENEWIKNHKDISVGIDTSWYPYDFTDENGKFSGIAADYFQYLHDSLSINFIPEHKTNWEQTFKLFQKGDIDVMSGIIATKERVNSIQFTNPYFSSATVIINNRDSLIINSMQNLAGKKLGMLKGYGIEQLIQQDYPDIHIVFVDSIVEGLERVQNKEVDAYLGTLAVVNHEIDRSHFMDLKISAVSPYEFNISMAVRKGLEPLVSILNKSIRNMSEKQKASITNDWLGVHIDETSNIKTILKWALPIIAIFLAIIFIISRFNKKLKIQILQRKRAEKELSHQASHDSLTDLPNWRNFEKYFTKSLSSSTNPQGAILFIDLDDFKQVNDSYGHNVGNTILIEVGTRLRTCIHNLGMVARIGGDEFIIHLCPIKDRHQITSVAQSIVDSIAEPFFWNDHQINIGSSIGISIYPDDASKLDDLMNYADKAMYKAKNLGKNTFQFHS